MLSSKWPRGRRPGAVPITTYPRARALGCSKGLVPRCQTCWAGRRLQSKSSDDPLIVRHAWQHSILPDSEDDRILRCTGNETRLLSFMSERRVNSATTDQKDRPKAVSLFCSADGGLNQATRTLVRRSDTAAPRLNLCVILAPVELRFLFHRKNQTVLCRRHNSIASRFNWAGPSACLSRGPNRRTASGRRR
jgi:hypothetical protein